MYNIPYNTLSFTCALHVNTVAMIPQEKCTIMLQHLTHHFKCDIKKHCNGYRLGCIREKVFTHKAKLY